MNTKEKLAFVATLKREILAREHEGDHEKVESLFLNEAETLAPIFGVDVQTFHAGFVEAKERIEGHLEVLAALRAVASTCTPESLIAYIESTVEVLWKAFELKPGKTKQLVSFLGTDRRFLAARIAKTEAAWKVRMTSRILSTIAECERNLRAMSRDGVLEAAQAAAGKLFVVREYERLRLDAEALLEVVAGLSGTDDKVVFEVSEDRHLHFRCEPLRAIKALKKKGLEASVELADRRYADTIRFSWPNARGTRGHLVFRALRPSPERLHGRHVRVRVAEANGVAIRGVAS